VADRERPPSSAAHPEHSPDRAGGEFITLARVVKTQGRHGEVAVEVHSDIPDRFRVGMRLLAWAGTANPRGKSAKPRENGELERRQLEVEGFWPHKGLLVIKFAGIDSISDAETLMGSELQVPGAERAPLEPGSNYVSDLVGCLVFDGEREVGRIVEVQFGAGEAPLLVLAGRSGEKLDVPFAEAYLESVDIRERRVLMHLPPGLLEINAPMTAEEKQEQQARPTPQRKPR
jgi:16S rRNA processing protein RimM